MIGKLISTGIDLATLPARVALNTTQKALQLPADLGQMIAEVQEAAEQAVQEVQVMAEGVEAEMTQKAAHLSPEQKHRAAELALSAAEQHLNMAATNMLRALWLVASSALPLETSPQNARLKNR